MATVTVNDSNLYDIADSIRAKLGVQTTYKPSQMADAIDSISGGGITPTGEIEITVNGTYDVTQYASADVDVPTGSAPVINSLSVTENGTYTAPTGVDGYSPITVNVSSGGSTSFATGTFTPSENITQWEIETDGNYDHFVLYTDTISAGHSVRALRIAETDFSGGSEKSFVVSTNNSGNSVALEVDYTTGAFSKNGTKFKYSRANTRLIGGIVHRWVAW